MSLDRGSYPGRALRHRLAQRLARLATPGFLEVPPLHGGTRSTRCAIVMLMAHLISNSCCRNIMARRGKPVLDAVLWLRVTGNINVAG